jgi:hypothetical protein
MEYAQTPGGTHPVAFRTYRKNFLTIPGAPSRNPKTEDGAASAEYHNFPMSQTIEHESQIGITWWRCFCYTRQWPKGG